MSSEDILDSRLCSSTSEILRRKTSSDIRNLKLWLIKIKHQCLDSSVLLALIRIFKEPSSLQNQVYTWSIGPMEDGKRVSDSVPRKPKPPPLSHPPAAPNLGILTNGQFGSVLSSGRLPGWCYSIAFGRARGWFRLGLAGRRERGQGKRPQARGWVGVQSWQGSDAAGDTRCPQPPARGTAQRPPAHLPRLGGSGWSGSATAAGWMWQLWLSLLVGDDSQQFLLRITFDYQFSHD